MLLLKYVKWIDAEFVEATTEIEDKKSFPCPDAGKYASQKEASWPQNSKHRDAADTQSAEQETFGRNIKYSFHCWLLKILKTKLTKEDLFGPDIKFDDDNKYFPR